MVPAFCVLGFVLTTLVEGFQDDPQLELVVRELIEMKRELNLTKTRLNNLEYLRDPPFTFGCGSQTDWISTHSEVITYNNLMYYSSNVEGASLDIKSGIFTAGHPGTYMVSWSMETQNTAGNTGIYIFLRKNGAEVNGSRTASYNIIGSGTMYEQGSRTVFLHLDRGDTLDLFGEETSSKFYLTTFCVSLAQFDVI